MKFKKLFFVVALVISSAVQADDVDKWSYHSSKDKLTDEETSYAVSRAVNYQGRDNFTIAFQCSAGEVRFQANPNRYITLSNKTFSLIYRVDKKQANEIEMRTFSNDTNSGFSYKSSLTIANDIIGGESVFVRAVTSRGKFLETFIPLDNSDSNIKKVFSDCGINLTTGRKDQTAAEYNFESFKSDFEKLSINKQNEVLSKIKPIMKKAQ